MGKEMTAVLEKSYAILDRANDRVAKIIHDAELKAASALSALKIPHIKEILGLDVIDYGFKGLDDATVDTINKYLSRVRQAYDTTEKYLNREQERAAEIVAQYIPSGTMDIGLLREIETKAFKIYEDAESDIAKAEKEAMRSVATVTKLGARQLRLAEQEHERDTDAANKRYAKQFDIEEHRVQKIYDRYANDRYKALNSKLPVISGIAVGTYFTDVKQAEKIIREINQNPLEAMAYAEGLRRYQLMADASLRYLVDAGRMSQKQYDLIKKYNEHYLALQRVMEISPTDDIGDIIGFHTGKAGDITHTVNVVKKIEGSAKRISDPYDALLDTIGAAIREGNRNAVVLTMRDALVGAANNLGEPLSDIGVRVEEGTKDAVKIFVNGEPEYWLFNKDVRDAFNGLAEYSMNEFWTALSFLPQLTKKMVIYTPQFAVRQMFTDFQQRLIITKSADSLKEWYIKKGDPIWEYIQTTGADFGGHYLRSRADYARIMRKVLSKLSTDKKTLLAYGSDLKDVYTKLISSSETLNRSIEFKRTFERYKRLGQSDYHAALMAQYESTDLYNYAMIGAWIKPLEKFLPFTNAVIRDADRIARGIHDNPGRFMARWATIVLPATIMVRLMSLMRGEKEDREYVQQPNYLKDMFYNIKVAPNTWLRIPKPYSMGMLGSAADRLMTEAIYRDEHAFDGYAGSLMRSFLPFDASDVAGGPASTAVELMTNTDLFFQRNIIPAHENRLDLELRDTSRASRIGQALENVFRMDARKIDFIMRDLFGNVGTMVMEASDAGREGRPEVISMLRTTTGMIRESPAWTSPDVQWILDKSGRRDLSYRPEMKRLFKKLDNVWDGETPKEKDQAARDLREYAHKVRSEWETKLPPSRRKVVNPNPITEGLSDFFLNTVETGDE
jgi:hypothetical protein